MVNFVSPGGLHTPHSVCPSICPPTSPGQSRRGSTTSRPRGPGLTGCSSRTPSLTSQSNPPPSPSGCLLPWREPPSTRPPTRHTVPGLQGPLTWSEKDFQLARLWPELIGAKILKHSENFITVHDCFVHICSPHMIYNLPMRQSIFVVSTP